MSTAKKFALRIPLVNTLPNRKVRSRESENRGKFSKVLASKQRERDIQTGIRLSNNGFYSTDFCFCCGAYSDEAFVPTPEYEVVCKECAAVQPSEKCFEDAIDSTLKSPTAYKERTYLSERLRLFGNLEPRIPREDFELIGQVYSELESRYSKIHDEEEDPERRSERLGRIGFKGDWFIQHPGNITKDFIQTLLTLIDQTLSPNLRGVTKSFKRKYLERWLQIKILLCGKNYYKNCICDLPDSLLLDDMLALACQVTSIFKNKKDEARIFTEKRSVPNVDLMFLMILYNIDIFYLRKFGWYFLSKAVREGSAPDKPLSAIHGDYDTLCKIFEYLNSQYQHRNPACDQFICCLEEGKWRTPEKKLQELIQLASTNLNNVQ